MAHESAAVAAETRLLRARRIRGVLKLGASVFALSAAALLAAPAMFNSWLGLESTSALEWAMRMIGITLIALTGNMWSHATKGTDESVLLAGKVMMVAAAALGILTLLVPATLGWFGIAYACVGFGFSAAYVWASVSK